MFGDSPTAGKITFAQFLPLTYRGTLSRALFPGEFSSDPPLSLTCLAVTGGMPFCRQHTLDETASGNMTGSVALMNYLGVNSREFLD